MYLCGRGGKVGGCLVSMQRLCDAVAHGSDLCERIVAAVLWLQGTWWEAMTYVRRNKRYATHNVRLWLEDEDGTRWRLRGDASSAWLPSWVLPMAREPPL